LSENDPKLSSNLTKMDHILNNGFNLRGHKIPAKKWTQIEIMDLG